MKILDLSAEYRTGGEACRERVLSLRRLLADEALSEMDKLLLRRRITILSSMGREAIATSNYLARYYTRAKGRRAIRKR